jgi:hypothetical protein
MHGIGVLGGVVGFTDNDHVMGIAPDEPPIFLGLLVVGFRFLLFHCLVRSPRGPYAQDSTVLLGLNSVSAMRGQYDHISRTAPVLAVE